MNSLARETQKMHRSKVTQAEGPKCNRQWDYIGRAKYIMLTIGCILGMRVENAIEGEEKCTR
jgi:hypothetical protein